MIQHIRKTISSKSSTPPIAKLSLGFIGRPRTVGTAAKAVNNADCKASRLCVTSSSRISSSFINHSNI